MILGKSNDSLISIINDIFKEGGTISLSVPNYKVRDSQKEAAERLICAVSENKNAVVEGPCGFGKTFVYLSAALLVAADNKCRFRDAKDRPAIVIATSGISLQEQLINKDIPEMINNMKTIIGDLIPANENMPTAASLKGRQNFICPLKFTKNRDEIQTLLSPEQYEKMSSLNDTVGDLNKLDFVLNNDVRNLAVCTSQHDCKNRTCPMYAECAYQRQKRKACNSDIIVCNYHVLFSSLEAPLLPTYNLLIWDEAHEAADVFRQFKTDDLSASWVVWCSKILSSILNTRMGKDIIDQITETASSTSHMFDKDGSAKPFMDKIGSTLSDYLGLMAKSNGIDMYSAFSSNKLIINEPKSEELSEMKYQLLSSLDTIKELCQIIADECVESLNNREDIPADEFDDISSCGGYASELSDSIDKHESILSRESYDGIEYCYFIKKDIKDRAPILALERMPVDIGKLFYENFMQDRDYSNVFTSATLSTGGNLEYCKSQLGLNLCDPEKVFEFIGQSPFNLEKQELWYLPKECVDGNKPQFETYFLDTLKELIRVSGKGMLILSTSISAMNRAHTTVKEYIHQLGRDTLVLKQNELPRNMLLKEFSDNGEAILVATKSFFTGIDIPGKALQVLVIDKLPFNSPDDPVALYLNTKGGNVFMDYSVPHMIITLKQAVGRGVRSITDRCVICIADGRMATARYRGKLGRSFPYNKTSTRNAEDIIEFLK